MSLLYVCLLFLAGFSQAQDPDPPLPDQSRFLEEFRKGLTVPDDLLSKYTYTQKNIEYSLDSKGKVKKTETNVYEVVHGAEDWQAYERHISKDGVPLTEKELEKQGRKRAQWSEAKRREEKDKQARKEREEADDVFASFDYQLVRREPLHGVSMILVNFKPKKSYKPKTDDGRMLQHVAGRVWITEDDHQLARLEAEVIDPIKIGAGLLAKLQKGSTVAFELQKINNEIWLPVKGEILINARVLLLKGMNMRMVVEFSNHKKFDVDTILKFGDVP